MEQRQPPCRSRRFAHNGRLFDEPRASRWRSSHMMRPLSLVIILTGVSWLSAAAFSRPPAAPKTTRVADLAWMTGNWHDRTDGWSEETWTPPRAGAMHGMCRIGEDASRAIYEILLLEDDGEGVAL